MFTPSVELIVLLNRKVVQRQFVHGKMFRRVVKRMPIVGLPIKPSVKLPNG